MLFGRPYRKEVDRLSLIQHREVLCYFVWGREEKSSCIVPLTAVRVKRKPGLKCPHWIAPNWLKHIKMPLYVHWPRLVASAASKALSEGLAGIFLKLRLLRIGVQLSTEAM